MVSSIACALCCICLITYCLITIRGNKKTNILFALFAFTLSFKILNSLFSSFTDEFSYNLLIIGLVAFLLIGPSYYFLTKNFYSSNQKFKRTHLLHLLPSIIITVIWLNLGDFRLYRSVYHLVTRIVLLQYIVYISLSAYHIQFKIPNTLNIRIQLRIINIFLIVLGFSILLTDTSGFPDIENPITICLLIYLFFMVINQKGNIFDLSSSKYKKTGLSNKESKNIFSSLISLMDKDKIYKENTLSLVKLAKRLNTNVHALSQVINEHMNKSYYEMIGHYRIEEAKKRLLDSSEKVSNIAFDVGYNSLSAFNTAFKKLTGFTPSVYRDEKKKS